MNTEWLHSFAEAAKLKSFSKASKELNLSQPALSKHIRNLEHDLDVTLFYRTSGGIELTEAGERFYTRIVPVISDLASIRRELQQYRQTDHLALGSLPSLATYYLPSRIKALQCSHTLMIQNTSGDLLQSLKEGRLDSVLVDSLYTDDSVWHCELFTECYYAVFSVDHRFRSKTTVTLSDLCGEPLIVHQAPCDTRSHIHGQMEALGHKPHIVNEVSFGDFIFGYVMAGMGFAIVPELVAKNIGHLNLFALPIADFKRSISLAAKSGKLGTQLSSFLLSAD
ncbi:LysR family transcriptional regulator [Paenibacillus elgii]|uniref:LysR family transcriptional regulator n=1 Tax=Paenibacillus elgii TaxID=189691 RepID=A0A2T6G247_9BACL|nr:LysR family transcriptional regulator [Paenibacillus elgii]PUA38242.1 LysR family transcriptional regulator [Paenibacillus elgii]